MKYALSHLGKLVAVAAFVAVGVLVVVAAGATPAFAHAGLVTASPAPGDGLPQAPGAVVLKFTEPLNAKLSHVEVLNNHGHDVAVGPSAALTGDNAAMQRKLGLLQPGIYTVHWTTVSSVDGHTLKGSYQFGIGNAPLNTEHVASDPIASEGWLGLFGTFVAFAGLAMWAGAAMLGAVGRRAGVSDQRIRKALFVAPATAFVGAAMWVWSSALVAAVSVFHLDRILLSSRSGHWRLVLLAASGAGIVLGAIASRRWARRLSAVAVVTAIVGVAASGHAGATAAPVIATISLTVHLLAVGVWIFAIGAAALSERHIRQALAVFAPYAIGAAIAVAATGALNTVFELNGLSELLTTSYGKVVTLKILALLTLAIFGFAHNHWRRSDTHDAKSLRDYALGELGTAIVAIGLAVVLVGFPNPPHEDAIADQLARPNTIGRLTPPAVSVADASGPFIVGLTLLPPRPGHVQVRVGVIGVEAGDALRNAVVRATSTGIPASDITLHNCGLGCFEGAGDITRAAMWHFHTTIVSNRGPITTSDTIPLPTPDGAATLQRAIEAMEQLHSAHLHEELRGSANSAPTISNYVFQAPDAFSFTVVGRSQSITIGTKQYSRDTPTGRWTRQSAPANLAFSWPEGYYREFWTKPAATRILGSDTIDGVPSEVVAFVRPDLPAWFRLWVGTTDGLVRRMEMRAEGHLMNQQYSAFNQPVVITPPP